MTSLKNGVGSLYWIGYRLRRVRSHAHIPLGSLGTAHTIFCIRCGSPRLDKGCLGIAHVFVLARGEGHLVRHCDRILVSLIKALACKRQGLAIADTDCEATL